MRPGALRLTSLNHISRLTCDLDASVSFWTQLLDFKQIRRPSFDFEGYWLLGYGIGLHLIHSEQAKRFAGPLDPRADHLSFTCESLALVEQRLKERGIPFVKQVVPEDGFLVSQVFFADPGGSGMVEVCNCDCLPITFLDGAQQALQAGGGGDAGIWAAGTLAGAAPVPGSSCSSDGSCHA